MEDCAIFASWVVSITLIVGGNFAKAMTQASSQAAALGNQVTGVGNKASALSKQMSAVAAAGKILDRSLIGVGLASGATFAMGIKGASDLQSATVQTAIAMNRTGKNVADTTDKMRDFHDIALKMSQFTGMDVSTAMGVVASMATAGVSQANIKTNQKAIASFVDILHFGKDKMDYIEAAGSGAGIVHDLRLGLSGDPVKDAAQTAFGLGVVTQMGYKSPHGTNQLITQVRRMAPALEFSLPGTVEAKARTITDLAAWADRMGSLPFAGSAVAQMLTQMIKPRSTRVAAAMGELGLNDAKGNQRFFNQKTGQFDLMGALDQIQKHMTAALDANKGGAAVKALFGGTQNMTRIMTAFASPEAKEAWRQIQQTDRGMGDPADWMLKTQTLLMGELGNATQILLTNFKSLATIIGEQFVGPLTKFIKVLSDATAGATSWLNDHPKAAQGIGIGMLVAAGYAGLRLLALFGGLLHIFQKLPGDITIGIRAHVGNLFKGIGDAIKAMFGHGPTPVAGGSAAARAAAAAAGGAAVAGGAASAGAASRIGLIARAAATGFAAALTLPTLRKAIGGTARWATTFRGFPGGGTIPGGMAGLGRDMMSGLKGIGKLFFDFVPGVKQAGAVIGWLGNVFGHMRFMAWGVRVVLDILGGILGKFGLRLLGLFAGFASGVGEIWLLIDAIKFAMDHMHSFGWVIGEIVGITISAAAGMWKWVQDNWRGIFAEIGSLAVSLMRGLLTELLQVFSVNNWKQMFEDLKNGVKEGLNDAIDNATKITLTDAQKKALATANPSNRLTHPQPFKPPSLTGPHATGPNAFNRNGQVTLTGDLIFNTVISGGKTPQETGNAVGASAASTFGHLMRKHGVIVSNAIGPGQGGAAHASGH